MQVNHEKRNYTYESVYQVVSKFPEIALTLKNGVLYTVLAGFRRAG